MRNLPNRDFAPEHVRLSLRAAWRRLRRPPLLDDDDETLVGDDTDDLLNGGDGEDLSEGAEPHAGPLTVIDFAPEEDRLEVELIYSGDEPPEVDVTSQVDAETGARNAHELRFCTGQVVEKAIKTLIFFTFHHIHLIVEPIFGIGLSPWQYLHF